MAAGGDDLPSANEVTLQFDLETAFVDRNRLIVPRLGEGGLAGAIDVFSGEGFEIEDLDQLDLRDFKLPSEEVVLPHDGVHIEPSPGLCELTNVPENDCKGEASFEFSCLPKDS